VSRIVAAAVQMTSTADVEANLASAERLISAAAARGAAFVGVPENFGFLRSEGVSAPDPQTLDGPWVARFASLARQRRITLLLGSLPEKIDGERKVHNTSVLIGPDGNTLAHYRKIHLFDIDLPGMEHLKESKAIVPGAERVVAKTAFGMVGLSICYDLRFPELYRDLTRRGARVLAVPSAFTERTGKAHWELLLRARAVENLAFVLAPAQVGEHGRGRSSWGHAMIVGPWGDVLAEVEGPGEGLAIAELDFERQDRVRRELPALDHVRLL
jgi:predicted amidohydrolase